MGFVSGAAIVSAMDDLKNRLAKWRAEEPPLGAEEILARFESAIDAIRKDADAGWY